MRLLRTPFLALAILLGATGCDSTEPTGLEGTWVATTFTYTAPGEPVLDVLAINGGLAIAIRSDLKTYGGLQIPSQISGTGEPRSFSMVGLVTLNGTRVNFDQNADTFVRTIDWTLSGDTMTGSKTASGIVLNITLTRMY